MIETKQNSPVSKQRGNLPQHNVGHIQQTQSHHSQQGKTDSISTKIRKKKWCPVSPLSFNLVSQLLAMTIREEIGKKKGIQIG